MQPSVTRYYAKTNKDKQIEGFLGTKLDGMLVTSMRAMSNEDLGGNITINAHKTLSVKKDIKNTVYEVHTFEGTPNPEIYIIISECENLSEPNKQHLCKLINQEYRKESPTRYRGKSTGAMLAIVSLLLTGSLYLYRKWKMRKKVDGRQKKRINGRKPLNRTSENKIKPIVNSETV